MGRWTKIVFDVIQYAEDKNAIDDYGNVKQELISEFQDHIRQYTSDRCKYIVRKGYKPGELNYTYLMIKCKAYKDAVLFRINYGEYMLTEMPKGSVIEEFGL